MGQISMFICLKCKLLVVGYKFESQDAECNETEGVIRGGELRMRLQYSGREGWHAEEEQKYVLDDGNEGKVCELEEPNGDLRAKNSPAVIFILTE